MKYLKFKYRLFTVNYLRGGRGGGGGKTAGDKLFYRWLVRKVFKLYGSLVFDQI